MYWIVIHLGKNPKNGGNPPRDNKLIIIINLVVLEANTDENIWLKWNVFIILNDIIIVIDKKQ